MVDISEFVIDRIDKKMIRSIMIDESMITVKEGRGILVMGCL